MRERENMSETNFELLGRFTEASDRALKYGTQRDSLLGKASDLISETLKGNGRFVREQYDVIEVQDLIRRAGEAHNNMIAAIEAAKNYGKACGREVYLPKVRW